MRFYLPQVCPSELASYSLCCLYLRLKLSAVIFSAGSRSGDNGKGGGGRDGHGDPEIRGVKGPSPVPSTDFYVSLS